MIPLPPDIDPGPFDDDGFAGPAPLWAWGVAAVLVLIPLSIIAYGLMPS